MCITAQCPDPQKVGVWWRDDAAWRLFTKPIVRAILLALLKNKPSLDFELASASYRIDLIKMEQINRATGHKRAIKIILPSSFKNPSSTTVCKKAQVSVNAVGGAMARFQMTSSCLLVIRKGNIAGWAVDGSTDAVVCPRRSWPGFQGCSKDMKSSLTSSSILEELLCSYSDGATEDAMEDHKKRGMRPSDGSNNIGISKGKQHNENAKGSVAAALERAAGPELRTSLRRCVQFGSSGNCGDAMVTSGFKLPASHIIHAIVPKYRSPKNVDHVGSCALLERTYKCALAFAMANGIRYLAFPAMACGNGGFPVGVAARVAMQVIGSNTGKVEEIHFVLMGEEMVFKEWVMEASNFFNQQNDS